MENLKGTIILHEKTGNLCINGTLPYQNFVKIKQSDIKEFELKEGDFVEYDSLPYQTVDIIKKLESLK